MVEGGSTAAEHDHIVVFVTNLGIEVLGLEEVVLGVARAPGTIVRGKEDVVLTRTPDQDRASGHAAQSGILSRVGGVPGTEGRGPDVLGDVGGVVGDPAVGPIGVDDAEGFLSSTSFTQGVVPGHGGEDFLGELRSVVGHGRRADQRAGAADLAGVEHWSVPRVVQRRQCLTQWKRVATDVDAALIDQERIPTAVEVELEFVFLGVVEGGVLLAAQEGAPSDEVGTEGDLPRSEVHHLGGTAGGAGLEVIPHRVGDVVSSHRATHQVQQCVLGSAHHRVVGQILVRNHPGVEPELLVERLAGLHEFIEGGLRLGAAGLGARASQGRQQQADEDHDDPDHHQQLGEGEARCAPEGRAGVVEAGTGFRLKCVHHGVLVSWAVCPGSGTGPGHREGVVRCGRPESGGPHQKGNQRAEVGVSPRSSAVTTGYEQTRAVCSIFPGSTRGRASESTIDLPQGLVGCDRDRGGEVEASGFRPIRHRNPDSGIGPLALHHGVVELVWQAPVLGSEEQMVPPLPARLSKRSPRLGREQPEALRILTGQVRGPVRMFDHVQVAPVIQPRPTARLVREREPQRMNQVQPGTDRERRPADVPGVVGNLRGVEHQVEQGGFHGSGFLGRIRRVQYPRKRRGHQLRGLESKDVILRVDWRS